ncbi:MAG: GIY-YIG nuclease family protein [Oscillospiraceae bacterium]|nr:GIY-YIG nuclease family protein [Oscillospiraceae bacterium]
MGYIYIMTNPALHDMVKIGYASNVEQRRQQLSTTALPYDYEIYATYETPGNLEDKKLHKMIDKLNPDLRASKSREFFIMSPEDAYELLEAIAVISGSQGKLKKAKGPQPAANAGAKTKRPPINFFKCGLPKGAELVYVDDPEVKVTVVDEHKVQYNGELTSLSAIAKEKKGYNVSGPLFFTYNGRLITDIAEETQWRQFQN